MSEDKKDDGFREIEGVFHGDELDRDRDMISPAVVQEAVDRFEATKDEPGQHPTINVEHDPSRTVGKVTKMWVDEGKAHFKAVIDTTSAVGREAFHRMSRGMLNSTSVEMFGRSLMTKGEKGNFMIPGATPAAVMAIALTNKPANSQAFITKFASTATEERSQEVRYLIPGEITNYEERQVVLHKSTEPVNSSNVDNDDELQKLVTAFNQRPVPSALEIELRKFNTCNSKGE